MVTYYLKSHQNSRKSNLVYFQPEAHNQYLSYTTCAKFHPNRTKTSFVKEVNGKEVNYLHKVISSRLKSGRKHFISNFAPFGPITITYF